MAYHDVGHPPLDYEPCRYAGSKLPFRGPKRALDGDYVAFLGGTDTYGKFIARPFPALVERVGDMDCVNFGIPNAGIDVFLNNAALLSYAAQARLTVLQVPCAQNMSNRFYQVHPRRNDRFLRASEALQALYAEVDFTEFHYTRHMLRHLKAVCPERFGKVMRELETAWVPRMRLLLSRIGGPVLLLWFSARRPEQAADCPDLACDPGFVSRAMLEALRGDVAALVEVTASDEAQAIGQDGMVFAQSEAPAAGALLGPAAHDEAAVALIPVIAGLVGA